MSPTQKDRIINPRRPGHYKMACHALMDDIFGDTPDGKKFAYAWLMNTFKEHIHFSQIDDEKKLKVIWEALYKLSFKVEHD